MGFDSWFTWRFFLIYRGNPSIFQKGHLWKPPMLREANREVHVWRLTGQGSVSSVDASGFGWLNGTRMTSECRKGLGEKWRS